MDKIDPRFTMAVTVCALALAIAALVVSIRHERKEKFVVFDGEEEEEYS